MTIKTIIALIFNLGAVVAAPPGGHVPSPAEVDAAIVNIELHYNEGLCLELLLVDCATHVIQGDEKVCGSDGITYENHCKFIHAMCEFFHSTGHHQVSLGHRGECMTSTLPSPTAVIGSTMTPATSVMDSTISTATVVMGSTMQQVSSAVGSTILPETAVQGSPSTMPPATVGTSTTTVIVTTTKDPIADIMQKVFCQNVATINCGNSFEIICGSDGQYYPNQCEMSKQKCKDPSLTVADKSVCPVSGR